MSSKFVFIIPLIDKARASDWGEVLRNLRVTINSVLNQSCADFLVLVVCSEQPAIKFRDDRVKFLTFLQSRDSSIDLSEDNFENRSIDKGRKLYYGLKEAKRLSATYVMTLDADDLVHRELVDYCLKNNKPDSWIVKRGYLYELGKPYLFYKYRVFNELCGSCNIFKPDKIPMPKSFDEGFDGYRLLINHQYFEKNVKNLLGLRVKTIPFPAVIYLLHNQNWFATKRKYTIFNIIKRLIQVRIMSKSIRNKFYVN